MTAEPTTTDLEWLTLDDPERMLREVRDRITPRQGFLLSCAAARAVWSMLSDECRQVVELAEEAADGKVTRQELSQMEFRTRVWSPTPGMPAGKAPISAAGTARLCASSDASDAGRLAWRHAQDAVGWVAVAQMPPRTMARPAWDAAVALMAITWADSLRDLFAPLFRPVTIEPAWRRWNNRAVENLAQEIYESRRFQELPILADALEEAGCDDPHILTHCREHPFHVRGCWVLDALLCKE